MLAQAYRNVSNVRERKADGPGSLQCEGIDVAPVAAQRDGGSGLGIVEDDRPLRIAGDVFRIGLLRCGSQGFPGNRFVLGTDMGVEDIGDGDGAFLAMAQLAVLLVGEHFVAIAGVEVRNLAYRSRFESAVRIARVPLYYARVTGGVVDKEVVIASCFSVSV